MALDRLALDRADMEALGVDQIDRARRRGLGLDAEPIELLAVEMGQVRGETAGVGADVGVDAPIFLRPESLDLHLALDHEAKGDRLDASRGARTRKLAPQDRRQRKADQIV